MPAEPVIAKDRLDVERGPAPRVGILVDWLEGEYQDAIVRGIVEAAEEHQVDVVCFVGGVVNSPDRLCPQRNVVYDLAKSTGFDGLIVLAGTLGNHRGLADLSEYCERFRPLPMISIAARMPGMTCIEIDGEDALRAGVQHLIEGHGYRRIAFVGGPEGNLEARARLQTFSRVLAEHGLETPDSHVTVGDFEHESGVEAVRLLLDERGLTLDAIVTANDEMALGVMDALRARGTRVPRDVGIMGFDDIREARYSSPPLTTVRQPLRAQGRLALEVLLRQMRGEAVEAVLTLPTDFVVRRSCGCYSDGRQGRTSRDAGTPVPALEAGLDVEAAIRTRRPRILAAIRDSVAGRLQNLGDGWDSGLLDSLVADLHGRPGGGFTNRVDALLEASAAAGGTGNAWQPALSVLRRELIPCLAADAEMRSHAEDLLQAARAMVSDVVEHMQAQRRLELERRSRTRAETAEAMAAALDLESLGHILDDRLPRLGVPGAYIVLYERQAPAAPESRLQLDPRSAERRLVLVHDPRRVAPFMEAGLAFAGSALLPDGVLPDDRPRALVVEPLFFKDDPLGYVAFELGPLDGLTYESLREQISWVLKVALLIDQLVATGAERTSLLEALQVRAGELEAAYGALKDNQDRLVSTEKMASLGRITANIAHEMNTPLAAVRTALVEIEKRAREYEASSGDDEVTAEDHAQIAAEMLAALGLARSAAERAARFVRGVKTQTRDISGQEKVRFDPTPVIEDALLLLSYDVRRTSCVLDFHPPAHPVELVGSPGLLSQVVTNLVTNALDAMPSGGGTVTVSLSGDGGVVRLKVQDTGGGIPAELRDRVFEPMFTTKPFGQGTGLGLAIVHDLVTGQLGGSLEFESEVGIGTTFTIALPCPKAP